MGKPILVLLAAASAACMSLGAGDEQPPPDGWSQDVLPEERTDGAEVDAPVSGNIDDMPFLAEENDVSPCEGHDGRECTDHTQCNDGAYCNGEERCGMFCGTPYCYTAHPMPCFDPPPADPDCAPPVCLEEQQACIFPPKDGDRDGYVDAACGGPDCDDRDEAVHPGLFDLCDGIDNNCNGAVDEEGWSVPEGVVERIVLSEGAAYVGGPALTASASGWHAAWIEQGTSLKFAAVDSGGTATVDTLATAEAGNIMAGVSILGGDENAHVVWSETGSTGSSILIKRAGASTGSSPALLYQGGGIIEEIDDLSALAAVPASSRAGIFFRMGVSGESGNYEIFYLPVLDFGAVPPVIAGDGTPVRLTHALGFSGHPDAASLEHGWTVLWDDDRDGSSEIYFMTIDFSGGFLSPARRITSSPGGAQDPKIACLPASGLCGIVWIDERYGNFTIFSTIMDAAGGLAGEVILSQEGSNAWSPALASDPVRDQMISGFSSGTQPNRNQIFLSVFGPDTVAAHDPIPLQAGSEGAVDPSLAVDDSGGLAAAWMEIGPLGNTGTYMTILACP